ncbi:MAG: HYR domain-containing protein, partial [Bacteroidia bacterium]|nr:HYR domain-containing protein [Bacteroidia bacterium]
LPSGSAFPVGTTTNTFVATDAAGNTATCSFDVTVNDTEDPVITCPADITVNNDPGDCGAIVDYESALASITFSESFTQGVPSPDCGAWNTFQSQLLNGLSYTSLTISGSMDPVGISLNDPAKVLQLADALRTNTAVTVVDGPNTWRTGGCGGGTEISVNQGICGCASNYSVRPCIGNLNWGGINGPTCNAVSQTMTVEFVYDTGAGGPIMGTDNCPGAVTVQTAGLPSGSFFPVGTTTNTFVVTDAAGNTASCSFDVTVNDNEPPVITCPADVTVECGDPTDPTATGTATATDNCSATVTFSDASVPGCGNTEVITRTWTATDPSGNSVSCDQIITVVDTTPPVANCPANIVVDNDPGECGAIVNYSVTGMDNCGSVTVTQTAGIASGGFFPVGTTTNNFTITDECGLMSFCSFDVTVNDTEPPQIVCPPDIVTSTDPDMCSAQVFFADAVALDNCGVGGVIQTQGPTSGNFFPVGTTLIEFTALDIYGNINTCTFTITVSDMTPPNAVCQDITIQLDANGNAMITAADVDGGSFDNCGTITDLSIDIDTFDCSDVGPNNVTLSVTDDNGNVGTCIAVVTVEDVTPPDAICQDITVQLDATGTVTINASDLDGGSTDACGIADFSVDMDTFDCSNVGPNSVILTVTDVNGNSATCGAVVTVEDVTDPVVTCMDIEVGLDENGEATIDPFDIIVTADDACGIDGATVDIPLVTCDDLGVIVVTVFVTDVNGNVGSCTANVTVKDGMDPILDCPADLTVEVDEGTQYEVPDFVADGTIIVTDNCTDPVTNITQTPAPGTLLDEGTYTVEIIAIDASGNRAECEFPLTVVGVLGAGDIAIDLSTIVMYPNPATSEVRISNPQNVALKEAIIFDMTGRLVGTHDLRDTGTDTALDISNLATATYTVVIKGLEGGQLIKQLIKE